MELVGGYYWARPRSGGGCHSHGGSSPTSRWNVPLDECIWCTTTSDWNTGLKLMVNGVTIKQSRKEEGFKVLGTMLALDKDFEVELNSRNKRAWGAFCKYRELLT